MIWWSCNPWSWTPVCTWKRRSKQAELAATVVDLGSAAVQPPRREDCNLIGVIFTSLQIPTWVVAVQLLAKRRKRKATLIHKAWKISYWFVLQYSLPHCKTYSYQAYQHKTKLKHAKKQVENIWLCCFGSQNSTSSFKFIKHSLEHDLPSLEWSIIFIRKQQASLQEQTLTRSDPNQIRHKADPSERVFRGSFSERVFEEHTRRGPEKMNSKADKKRKGEMPASSSREDELEEQTRREREWYRRLCLEKTNSKSRREEAEICSPESIWTSLHPRL